MIIWAGWGGARVGWGGARVGWGGTRVGWGGARVGWGGVQPGESLAALYLQAYASDAAATSGTATPKRSAAATSSPQIFGGSGTPSADRSA